MKIFIFLILFAFGATAVPDVSLEEACYARILELDAPPRTTERIMILMAERCARFMRDDECAGLTEAAELAVARIYGCQRALVAVQERVVPADSGFDLLLENCINGIAIGMNPANAADFAVRETFGEGVPMREVNRMRR
ncbi:MAG: hypothetical protein FWD15_02530 [Alphaproteobacteria bacterium]|nr:hypothetical protein [Alphaproteobacteria bacterium]